MVWNDKFPPLNLWNYSLIKNNIWTSLSPIETFDIVFLSNESDPNGKQPHEPGAKLDAGKSPIRRGVLEYFPRAISAVADVSAAGAEKYAWKGWETVPDGIDRYGDAAARHAVAAVIEGPFDKDTGKLHAAHEAWNCLAKLELTLREMEKENA